MGLIDAGLAVVMVVAIISGLVVVLFLLSLPSMLGLMLWTTLQRGLARLFTQFAAYLYVWASKAVISSFRSTSELPHSKLHRRRDLIGASAILHEYPGVIPSYNSRSDRMLNRYSRYLNAYAKIPNTNVTIFWVRSWL